MSAAVPPPPPPRKFISKLAQTPPSAALPPPAAQAVASNPQGGTGAPPVSQRRQSVRVDDDAQQPVAAAGSIPAGWTSPSASAVAPPPSSIMKRSPLTGPLKAAPPPLIQAMEPTLYGAATGRGGSATHDEVLKLRLLIEELLRENRNLHTRVAKLLESTNKDQSIALSPSRLSSEPKAAAHQATDIGAQASSAAGETVEARLVVAPGEHRAGSITDASEQPNPVASAIEQVEAVLDEQSPPPLLIARIKRLEVALQLESLERDECETKLALQQRLIAYLLSKQQVR